MNVSASCYRISDTVHKNNKSVEMFSKKDVQTAQEVRHPCASLSEEGTHHPETRSTFADKLGGEDSEECVPELW